MKRVQDQSKWLPLAVWLAPAIAVISIAGMQPFFPVDELMRDAYTMSWSNGNQMEPHFGALSMAGLFIWAAAAAICLFAAAIFRSVGDRGWARLFFACGLLTAYILADDAFLLHEVVAPSFGGSEKLILALIGGGAAWIAFKYWRYFRSADLAFLTAAISLLGFSVAFDIFFGGVAADLIFIEDGAKFIGAWAWLGFIGISARKALYANFRLASL